jgi:tetratricopeptide (TPR) repeat protein
LFAGLLLLPVLIPRASAQGESRNPPSQATASVQTAPAAAQPQGVKEAPQPTGKERRRAAKLFLDASKLFEKEEFEQAMRGYRQAAALDPANADYRLAADLARSHAVTALIQAAAKDRIHGDSAAARLALAHARDLEPANIQVAQHFDELAGDALLAQPTPVYQQALGGIGEAVRISPGADPHSFHLRTDQRSGIKQVFKAYGLEATVDESIRPTQLRLDLDDATFQQATRALSILTKSFYVPLDTQRVLVATNTSENHLQLVNQEFETIYLPGLDSSQLTDVTNLAKNVFNAQQAVVEPNAGTVTIRAPARTLNAINATLRQLLDGHSQVILDVRMIQVAHTAERNTGIQPPQQFTAFNAYTEEQSIINANQSLVQQIISSGLAAPGDTLAILGILLASGQVSSSLFSNGVALFGGGITLSGLSPGPAKANFNFNSSDSRQLDRIQLRLGDGEVGTLRTGTRYPIQTSSYSSLSASIPNIPGLTSAGSSGALSSLLSAYNSVPPVPQVEYQDLGLTLKATPGVMRNGDVALNIDLKIDALAGQSINGNPVLNSRAYSGVVTLRQGESAVVISDLNKQESRAISGTPVIGEIPGLNNIESTDKQQNYASLLIVITPHVVRGAQAAGHSPLLRLDPFTPR